MNEIAEILKIEKQITYDLKLFAKRKLIRKEIKNKILNKIEEFEQKKIKYLEVKSRNNIENITAKNNEEKAKIMEELFQIHRKTNRHSNPGINLDTYLLNQGCKSINLNELRKAKKFINEMKRNIDYVKLSPTSCMNVDLIHRSKKNFQNIPIIPNYSNSRKNQSPISINLKSENYHTLLRKAKNMSQFGNNIINSNNLKSNYIQNLPHKNRSICNISHEKSIYIEDVPLNNNLVQAIDKSNNKISSFEENRMEKINNLEVPDLNECKEKKKYFIIPKKSEQKYSHFENKISEKEENLDKCNINDQNFLLNNEEVSNFDWVQHKYSTKFVELINRKKKNNQLQCETNNYKTAELIKNDLINK